MSVSPINSLGPGNLTGAYTTRQAQQSSDVAAPAAVAAAESGSGSAQASEGQLREAVKSLNEVGKTIGQGLQFSVDEGSGKTVVKVVDSTTQEVLRQIPTEEALAISRSISKMQGLLLKDQA